MNVVPNWAYLGSLKKKRLYRYQFLLCFQVRRMTRSLAGQMEGLRRREDSSSSNVPKSLKNREKQITKMMAIIFATFLMTYIPGYLVKQVRFFGAGSHYTRTVHDLPLYFLNVFFVKSISRKKRCSVNKKLLNSIL